ncbi:MAG TPA: low temperature requirement protein A [Acidimicrobiia bacterium]
MASTTSRWKVPMAGRSRDEEGRTATPLELLFDLVFVVAIAFAAAALHHDVVEGLVGEAIVRYFQVFFAIWWAWMNFTWFASAYDTDDVPYRLATFAGITGCLIMAAGVPQAFDVGDFTVVTIGYVVMRLALVSLWVRAGRDDPEHAPAAFRYAGGVALVQVGWILLLFAPEEMTTLGFALLVVAELAVPVWAESASLTTWHREHIEERYGLFTIIVLGESILASSLAIQTVMGEIAGSVDLILIIVGGLISVFSMWWLYFAQRSHDLLTSFRSVFTWGYGHYLVWASAAAVGAGLAVSIDHATGHGNIGGYGAGAAFAIPAAAYIATLWILHYVPRHGGLGHNVRAVAAVCLILLTPFTGQAVLLTGVIMSTLLATKLWTARGSD